MTTLQPSEHSVSVSTGSHSDLADLMAQNVGTDRRFCRLQERSKSSARASKQLRSIMRGEKQQTDGDDTEAQSDIGEGCHFKTSEETWNAEKETIIKTLFKAEIENREINMEIKRSKLLNHADLKDENPKRVLEKVRPLWRSLEKSTETLELPSEQESLQQRVQRCLDEEENNSEIVPPTVTSSIRNVFSSSDLDKIRSIFKEMMAKSVPISKPRIKALLEKENWMHILNTVSLDTLINRVKYERRLNRSLKATN